MAIKSRKSTEEKHLYKIYVETPYGGESHEMFEFDDRKKAYKFGRAYSKKTGMRWTIEKVR